MRHRRALLFVAAVALAREPRLPAPQLDRPLPARVDVEMIAEVEVWLPAWAGGFVSPAQCWWWRPYGERDDRFDRPPAVADAAANLASRASGWVRSGRGACSTADLRTRRA